MLLDPNNAPLPPLHPKVVTFDKCLPLFKVPPFSKCNAQQLDLSPFLHYITFNLVYLGS